MIATGQLRAVLAMPASLRPFLLGAPSQIRTSQARFLSTSIPRLSSSKYPNVAALLVPQLRTSQLTEITPDELFKSSSLPSAPDKPFDDELTKLFTKNPATFHYAESDFYKLKKNTRVPEVCILGRSNVGKSSFLNALANRQTNGIAHVSSRAGRTRSINTYGFGPAPLPKDLAAQAAEFKGKEDIPTHAFHLVDMPGYGHASLKEWGRNIALYLSKRTNVKGAVVLIDAEVGPKDSDLHLLELLSSAELRTAIVLTKADKVRGGINGLRDTCIKVWDVVREIDSRKAEKNWVWEKDIFVTAVGARDHAVVKSTVTTARLAVARLAGLVEDNRPKPEKEQKWSGKIISFDDLQFAPSEETGAASPNIEPPAQSSTRASGGSQAGMDPKSPFADLERASRDSAPQGRTRPRMNAAFSSQSSRTAVRTNARAFHSTATRPQSSKGPRSQELQDILTEFVQGLKTSNTARDHVRRIRQERERRPQVSGKKPLQESDNRFAASLRKRYPEQTARTRAVHDRRLTWEEERKRALAEKQARKAAEMSYRPEKKPQAPEDALEEDEYIREAIRSSSSKGQHTKGKAGQEKGKGKGKGGKKPPVREPVDEFEAQFQQKMQPAGNPKGSHGRSSF